MPTTTVSIPNTTFVSTAQPNSNFSYYPLMYTGTDSAFQYCISLLQIDLPTLPVTQVDSAILELSVIVKSGINPSPVVVNRVLNAYSNTSVTYNTIPPMVATASSVNVATSDLYTSIKIDVTGLVNNWLNETYPNCGIALVNQDWTTAVQFATNAIVYAPYFPKLTLTYSAAPADNNALCFSYAQLANVIRQLITLYPKNVMTVFTTGLTPSAVSGTPYELYVSPDATYGTLFVLKRDGSDQAVPLDAITAIYVGDGTVYNPSISYLPTPTFSAGCDKNLITAYHSYLPLLTNVQLYLGTVVQASGQIYKDEYGLWVLSDESGNTPIFVPVVNIAVVVTDDPTTTQRNLLPQESVKPHVEIINHP